MRFTIVAILWLTLYVALVLTSLRNPTAVVSNLVELFSVASITIIAVIAFDRRSTPAFAFVVFSIAAALSFEISSEMIIAAMSYLNITTDSVEYVNLQKQLFYHLVIVVGIFGALIGRIVRQFGASTIDKAKS